MQSGILLFSTFNLCWFSIIQNNRQVRHAQWLKIDSKISLAVKSWIESWTLLEIDILELDSIRIWTLFESGLYYYGALNEQKINTFFGTNLYGVRNLDMSIRFSLKSRPSEGFPRPEMSQIKAEISLHTNLKLIFHKNVGWQGYQWIPWFL